MIEVRNLKKSFGSSVILENVNLEVKKGETVVIIGGSGCGKSTLLRCMNHLTVPDEGEVLINGKNILRKDADIDAIRRNMGMVYQQFNLFSHLNVMENVILAPMKVLGVDREAAIKEAEEQLGRVGMLRYKYNMPDSLSGGQKQRVAIARALAMHPEVMLFDEPTSALDPTMVDEVENVIRRLVDEGMTSVIVTHEMRFARSIASRVVFLAEKGIYEEGTPEQLFEAPKRSLTRQFLYRSRMYEKTFDAESFDPDGMRGEMNTFLSRYEHTTRQMRTFAVIMDELIYPVITRPEIEGRRVTLRLLCSESNQEHSVMVNFEGAPSSPLTLLDELNTVILKGSSKAVTEAKSENGWEVTVRL